MEGRALLLMCLISCVGSKLVSHTDAVRSAGVCYGMVADNIPPPATVAPMLVDRCKYLINVRIYEPNLDVLNAFNNSIPMVKQLIIGTRNDDLPNLATKPENARWWVDNIIVPFIKVRILGIIVGNEVIPGPLAVHVAPAMRNLRTALDAAGRNTIYVSTTLFGGSLANSFPPSASTFSPESIGVMTEIVTFMNSVAPESRGPLFLHVYPYFPYSSNLKDVSQDYVMFRPLAPIVQDGAFAYHNMFDAMFDSYVWAMEKIGGGGIPLVVGETGWPSAANGDITTPALAAEYNSKLFDHLATVAGTPKTAASGTGWPELVLFFSLFNENKKPDGVEQHWGVLYPDMSLVYQSQLCV